jgi:hypothetical protein
MVLHNSAVLLPRTVYAHTRFAGMTPPVGGPAKKELALAVAFVTANLRFEFTLRLIIPPFLSKSV